MAVARENIETDIENFEDQEGGIFGLPKMSSLGLGRSNPSPIPKFREEKFKPAPQPTQSMTSRAVSVVSSFAPSGRRTTPIPKEMNTIELQQSTLLESSSDIKNDTKKFYLTSKVLFNNLNSTKILLDSQKVRVIQLLCKIILHETTLKIKNLFDQLKIYSNYVLQDSDDNTIADQRTSIETTINDASSAINIADQIKDALNKLFNNEEQHNTMKTLFLQLLIICFYPNVILRTIFENMTKYITYIKKNSARILNDDSSVDIIRNLVNGDNQGGGARYTQDELADAAVARRNEQEKAKKEAEKARQVAEHNELMDAAIDLGRKRQIQDDAVRRAEEEHQLLEDAESNQHAVDFMNQIDRVDDDEVLDIINIMKNYNNGDQDPYVKNSGIIFYNALTNFATSMSIKATESKLNKDVIINQLYTIFKEQLDIKSEDEIKSNQNVDLAQEITKLTAEIESLETQFYRTPAGVALKNAEDTMRKEESDTTAYSLAEALKNILVKEYTTQKTGNAAYFKIHQKKKELLTYQEPLGTQLAKNKFSEEIISISGKTDEEKQEKKRMYKKIMENIYDGIDGLRMVNENNYMLAIKKAIINGIRQSTMFQIAEVPYKPRPTILSSSSNRARIGPSPEVLSLAPDPTSATAAADDADDASMTIGGGKRRTRRYKKRAGTRRQKKRRGTHRKRKNTTK
jgi:hypothetical protein